MTKEEYAEARDAFAKVARDIEELVADWFLPEWARNAPEDEEGYADYLNTQGFYLTGDDYLRVKEAQRLFETLAGRNGSRALS